MKAIRIYGSSGHASVSLDEVPVPEPALEEIREQQASALAYFDAFLIFAVVALVLAFLVLLMKRSVAEKGPHLAAE